MIYKKNNIIFMGLKHCGKSTQGQKLANKLSWTYYDLDDELLKLYSPEKTTTVRNIYREKGKEFFQKLEVKSGSIIAQEMKSKHKIILSLGGGSIENKPLMNEISNFASLIYLETNADDLFKRIKEGGIPPFLSQENPYSDFIKLYNKRDKLYKDSCDLLINLDNCNIDQAFNKVYKELDKICNFTN